MTPVALIFESMLAFDDFVFADGLVQLFIPWLWLKFVSFMERWSEVVLHLAGHLFSMKKQIKLGFVKLQLKYETFMNKLKYL